MMIKNRHYRQPSQLPFVPGYELAGTVKAVGKNVTQWKEGDRVLGLKLQGTGAFAEYCILDEKVDVIHRLPYSIDAELAPSLAVAYVSGYLGMKRLAMDKRGNSFLILTSRGTIGLATMDLAQNLFEGVVFGASDSEEKLQYLRDANVMSTLNWTNGKLVKSVHEKTFGKGVDFVVDTVGGDVFHQGLQCLKSGGHLLSLGFSSTQHPTLSILDLHRYNASVSGICLSTKDRKEIDEAIDMLTKMFDEGFLKGLKLNKYPLADVHKCLQDMEKPSFFGKAVLTVY
ncbi:hypothetical protein AAVH_03033 [Aphelenchoides avenae]|nr:hypothetical protein AAVH_03033 [Aphelenchus avenae]